MKSTKIITFIITIVFLKHSYSDDGSIFDANVNYFYKTNEKIHNITKGLLNMLVNKGRLNESPKIQVYKTMHAHLTKMAATNYDIYTKIKNITQPDIVSITINNINISEVIKDILIYNAKDAVKMGDYYLIPKDIDYPDYVALTQRYDNATTTDHSTESNVSSDFEDSKEFKQFIRDFVVKINMLSLDDFSKKPQRYTDIRDESFGLKSNLKVWRPSKDYSHLHTDNRRIYKGTITTIRQYPFVASIHVLGQLMCAGSVISSNLILTAASCLQVLYNNQLYRENPIALFVRVGSTYAIRDGELIPALKVHFYPTYNPENLNHNLAVIRLQRHIKFTKTRNKRVRRIILDKNQGILPTNAPKITLLGWGARDKDSIISVMPELAVTDLDIYRLDECKKVYSKYYVTDHNFCTGFLSRGGGACNRDVGGPGIIEGALVGVVSFGPAVCWSPDSPTVFTMVGYYLNWIEEIMDEKVIVHNMSTTLRPHIIATKPFHLTRPRPMQPIIKNTTSATENLVLRQMRKKNMFDQKHGNTHKQMYQEEYPEWNDNIMDIFTTTPSRNVTIPYDMIYGPFDDDDAEIFTTTQKQNPLYHPLINKSLIYIPEKFGIVSSSDPRPLRRRSSTSAKAALRTVIYGAISSDSEKSYYIEDFEAESLKLRSGNQIKGTKSQGMPIDLVDDLKFGAHEENPIKTKSRHVGNKHKQTKDRTLKPTRQRAHNTLNIEFTKAVTDDQSESRIKVDSIARNPRYENNNLRVIPTDDIENIIKNNEWDSQEIMLLFSTYYKEQIERNQMKTQSTVMVQPAEPTYQLGRTKSVSGDEHKTRKHSKKKRDKQTSNKRKSAKQRN